MSEEKKKLRSVVSFDGKAWYVRGDRRGPGRGPRSEPFDSIEDGLWFLFGNAPWLSDSAKSEAMARRIAKPDPVKRVAAVAIVQSAFGGRLLCVWNRRYRGWALPGGMVEEGEGEFAAMKRELCEETGIALHNGHAIACVHRAPVTSGSQPDRASVCVVFRVGGWDDAWRDAKEQEPGCPVTWLTPEEFLKWSPFREFYTPVFAKLNLR